MISSRTPEGWPNKCPVCGHNLCIEPSTFPVRDAPCPDCGTLLDFDEPGSKTIELSSTDLMELVAELEVLSDQDHSGTLRFDFGGKDFDSALLGKLVTIHRKVQSQGGKLVLCNISPSMREVFKITKLDRILGIEEEEDEKDDENENENEEEEEEFPPS